MRISVYQDKTQMARAAAVRAAQTISDAIKTEGRATVVFAAATSQLEFLESLVAAPGVKWDRVVTFQLDEYIGLDASHPASFRRFLEERVISLVHPGAVHLIDGEAADSQSECDRLNALIGGFDIDLALVGIGENGHLAFNDPPADFDADAAYAIVELDEACRNQQAGEGWFSSIVDVPGHAISMSIMQIMRSRVVVCTVPDGRKAQAVRDCLGGDVSPFHPASILQEHEQAHIYLDEESAGDLFVDDRRGEWLGE